MLLYNEENVEVRLAEHLQTRDIYTWSFYKKAGHEAIFNIQMKETRKLLNVTECWLD